MTPTTRQSLIARLLAAGNDLCTEAALALGETESPQEWISRKESTAWAAVVAALDEVKPDWVTQGSGGEMASAAIREIAGRTSCGS